MATEALTIDFWDVGQGDATVVTLPDGKLILIDVGPRSSPIVDWLNDHHSASVFAVVVTHNDADHAGCLQSVVKMPGLNIEHIYLLQDRDRNSEKFQKIYRPVREEEAKGRLRLRTLTEGTTIWSGTDHSIRVYYPNFSANLEASTPNQTSGIIGLLAGEDLRIVWPGDAPMQAVSNKCSGTAPFLLNGPHHGAPTDKDHPDFSTWVDRIQPERLFVSVGTHNTHGHPNAAYLTRWAKKGCHIACSQLTRECDRRRVEKDLPVISTAILLGLRPTRTGVPCRGCMRLSVRDGAVIPDPWDARHRQGVGRLRRPRCVVR